MIRSTSKFVLAVLLACAVPALAGNPAGISGVVRNSDRVPLMGVVVELLGPDALPLLTAFTDIRGHYQFTDLAPGRYSLRVLPAFPSSSHRQKVNITSGSDMVVNLTLTTLFDVSQWFPVVPRSAGEPADDWKWTLRTGVDRPILRWMDAVNSRSGEPDDATLHSDAAHPIRVHAAVTSGSSRFGEGGLHQEALVRMREGDAGEAILHVQSSTSGAAFLAGGIGRSHGMDGMGGTARCVATFRTLPVNDGTGPGRLQILQVRGGEQIALSDALRAQFGAETEAVQASQSATAAFPFMAVHFNDGGNEVSYRLATSSDLQGLEDLAVAGGVPAMAMQDGRLRITRSLHQEFSLQHEFAGMQMEAAYFYDHIVNPVLNGYGDSDAAEFSSGNVLLDPVTGAFRSAGPEYSGGGFRILATRQVKGGVWTAVEFANGPAIILPASAIAGTDSFTDALTNVATTRTQSVSFSMHGRFPNTDTRWTAGYRWQPEETITAVDPFNTGLHAPFLSVTLRQPLGPAGSPRDRLELEFVMENLLAQGYRPIYVVAGQTLYFAQAPRLITGGLAYSF